MERSTVYSAMTVHSYRCRIFLNTGIVETTEDTVKIKFQVRSSVATKLDDMQNKLDLATDLASASREISGEYPAWSYNADSVIRPKAIELIKNCSEKNLLLRQLTADWNVESYTARRMILISFLSVRILQVCIHIMNVYISHLHSVCGTT